MADGNRVEFDDGMVRLYRMQAADPRSVAPVSPWIAESDGYRNMLTARGRWFTDDLDEALWYAGEHPGGEIVYVDLPRAEAEAFRVSRLARLDGAFDGGQRDRPAAYSARPEKEFFVSREVAESVTVLQDAEIQSGPHPGP